MEYTGLKYKYVRYYETLEVGRDAVVSIRKQDGYAVVIYEDGLVKEIHSPYMEFRSHLQTGEELQDELDFLTRITPNL